MKYYIWVFAGGGLFFMGLEGAGGVCEAISAVKGCSFCRWNEVRKVQVEFGRPFSADGGHLLQVD